MTDEHESTEYLDPEQIRRSMEDRHAGEEPTTSPTVGISLDSVPPDPTNRKASPNALAAPAGLPAATVALPQAAIPTELVRDDKVLPARPSLVTTEPGKDSGKQPAVADPSGRHQAILSGEFSLTPSSERTRHAPPRSESGSGSGDHTDSRTKLMIEAPPPPADQRPTTAPEATSEASRTKYGTSKLAAESTLYAHDRTQHAMDRTQHAQEAVKLTLLFVHHFAKQTFGHPPRKIRVNEPDALSTDGGLKARQSIVLVPANEEARARSAIVCGWLDSAKKTAEIRTLAQLKQIHDHRFKTPFGLTESDYDRMLSEMKDFMRLHDFSLALAEDKPGLDLGPEPVVHQVNYRTVVFVILICLWLGVLIGMGLFSYGIITLPEP